MHPRRDPRLGLGSGPAVCGADGCQREVLPDHGVCAARTASIVSTIPVKLRAPDRNASTATSFAALNTAGAVPPVLPAARARRTAGNASSSRGSKVHVCALVQSHAGDASGTRSGHVSPRAIGSRMSGGLAWASVDPSTNSTIEWTTDWGCTITVIRSIGMSKSRCASITSRPLFTRVAELIVMTGPIAHVGCAIACSGVTSTSSARVRPRNGPPLAVSTSRRTSSARPPTRHWASAECSESTGTICPGAAVAVTRGPPMIRDSLLARARLCPARSAASVGSKPTAPVIPLRTTSHERPASSVAASGPARTSGSRPAGRNAASSASSAGAAAASAMATTGTSKAIACSASRETFPPPAASPTTRNRPGLRTMTSRAWVPIEPVLPRRMTSLRAVMAPLSPIRAIRAAMSCRC